MIVQWKIFIFIFTITDPKSFYLFFFFSTKKIKNEVAWKDKKEIHFISSCTNPEEFDFARRRHQREIVDLKRPSVVRNYNLSKGGVDLMDQRISYNKIRISKLKRAYLQIFFELLDIIIENSRICHQEATSKKLSSKKFRSKLVQQLSQPLKSKKETPKKIN